MKKNVLYELLGKLDASELKDIRGFARLYYREGSDPIKILDYAIKRRTKPPTIDDLRSRLFPDATNRNVSNKLGKLKVVVEDYLAWKQLKKKSEEKEYLLAEAYIEHGMIDESKKTLETTLSKLQDKSYDVIRFYEAHKIYEKCYSYISEYRTKYGLTLLRKSVQYLEKYNQHFKIKFEFENKFVNRFIKKSNTSSNFILPVDFLESECPTSDLLNELSIIIDNPSHQYIERLIPILAKWPIGQITDFFRLAYQRSLNTAINIYSNGNLHTKDLILELYQIGLKKNVYLKNGVIYGNTFCSIIHSISALGSNNQARQIIKNYSNQILLQDKSSALILTKAEIALNENNFNEVLILFKGFNPEKIWSNILFRWIKLVCLIAIPEEKLQFESFHRSFYAYFNKNKTKMSLRNHNMSINLHKILWSFYKGKMPSELLLDINNNPHIAMKTWLTKFLEKEAG